MNADRLDSVEPLSEAERLELGAALKETMNTPGWALIRRLIDKTINLTAMAALDSATADRPVVYFKGQVDALRALVTTIDAAVEAATADAKGRRRAATANTIATMMKPGGGPLG
jgi:hypothetical protein